VLVPVGAKNVAGAPIETHWATLALQGNCRFLDYVTVKVLPHFTVRNAKRISEADCTRLGIGLYAQVLMPAPGQEDTQ